MDNQNTRDLDGSSSIVAIAISGGKKCKYVVKWALENMIQEGEPSQISIKLLHVVPPIISIPTPMGRWIPIPQVRDDIATAFRKEVEVKTNEKILPYTSLCLQQKVQVEVVKIESEDVVNAIAEEIGNCNIRKLVIGINLWDKNPEIHAVPQIFTVGSCNLENTSLTHEVRTTINIFQTTRILVSYWMPRGTNLSARISEVCPSFCTVYVVSKGKLSSVRPSDPEALIDSRDDIVDNGRFSNPNLSPNYSMNSQPERKMQRPSVSYPHLPPPPPPKIYQPEHMNQSLVDQRRMNLADATKTLSFYMEENYHDGGMSLSSTSSSDIDARSKTSSFQTNSTENHSWSTNQSSSLNASTEFSSGSQVNINFELEQLRMELRQVQGMYAKAQLEAVDASKKLKDLNLQRLEETNRLKEISLREEEAKELAEQEKARYEASKKEAEYAKELAEKEAALKKAAEKKAIYDAKTKEKLEALMESPVHHYQEFTWDEITRATSGLSNEFKIGMGSYGTVYKCTVRHTFAAVKILHSMATNKIKQFQLELEILSKIRHPNLLTLLGACPERGCLVYVYMENGSLEERLFRKNNTPPIAWFDRYRIAREIASALIFLHNSKPKPIIHRDLKPANILLDQNLVSKIGDVGLSTMIHADASNMVTMFKDTSPVGTLCYIDPEYQRTGLVSPKSDIYAFGMVVLQLLTAKPAIALTRAMEAAIDNDCLEQVLDAEAGNWPIEDTKELAILALRCTELRHRDRPDLRNLILPTLEKLRGVAEKGRDTASSCPTEPLSHFICPLLKDLMSDPCVAADGYTYDRNAILEWFDEHDTSPVTNLPLPSKCLIPNYTLLSAIAEWNLRKH